MDIVYQTSVAANMQLFDLPATWAVYALECITAMKSMQQTYVLF
jgi:hypothetical protein